MTQINLDRQKTITVDSNLTVALRIRPISEDEIIQGATPTAHKVDKKMVVLIDPADDPDDILRINRSREKQYVFDVTFDGNTTQEEVYQNTSSFLIPNVISGFNATVFAYGATGAGKTHTMLGTEDDPGIMARALNDLFKEMDKTKEDMTYSVSMSYLEIYNEMIRDLLNPSSGYLELREDSKGVQVAGLVEVSAFSTREVMDVLTEGNKERTQEPTAANKTSSRSHAILQVTVKQKNRVRNIMQEVRVGKLFLIDLAGSERAAATHNRGKRMVEGAHINRSLLALGNCINALSDKNGSKYVNYRDSKLTRLLKDALGGNCKTVMIAHISPASIHFEESRNTLVYADRAKHIKTKVRKNVVDVTYHIAQYTNIIAELREEIGRLRVKLDEQSGNKNAAVISAIQSEVMHAPKSENQSEVARLREQLLDVFNIQMELRRSLMEFNNTTIEITLETSRNQLLVQKWEKEKILRKNRAQGEDTFESDGDKDVSSEKQRDLEGTGSDDIPEPEEVKTARHELQLLEEEKAKTEALKAKVQKELEQAKKRAAKIEETLPRKVGSEEQKEIIHLLCKVHELEIENMEMQSACLLWNFDSRRKDMIISKQYQHHQLCDEIIAQQRTLLDTHQVACPKDLDELYELYQQETEQRPEQEAPVLPSIDKTGSMLTLNRRLLESDSTSDMDKFSVLDMDSASLLSARLFPLKKPLLKLSTNNMARLDEADSNNKIFSQSPKFREIREAAAKEAMDEMGSRSFIAPLASARVRQESIITLSSRSDATSPVPAKNKTVITTDTRNIAALAARRKNKAHLNAYNSEKQKDDNYLSASRLANHDQKYGTASVGIRHLLEGDNYSIGTGETTARTVNKNGKRAPRGRRNRTRTHDVNYQQMTPEIFFRQLNTTNGRRHGDQGSVNSMARGRNTRLPQPNTSRTLGPSRFYEEDDIRELSSVETPPTNIHQAAPDKGRGLSVQRKLRSQNDGHGHGQKTARKPPPSIPSFRKGDMAITGFALQR